MFQGVFRELPTLRMLRLDNNKLEELNGILAGQTQLRFLNVSENRLQWFDYAFLPKSLEWLDLHSNQIEDLGESKTSCEVSFLRNLKFFLTFLALFSHNILDRISVFLK